MCTRITIQSIRQKAATFTLALCLGVTTGVAANPIGEQVVHGQLAFSRQGSQLLINQASHKAIVNWQDFSIAAGELTKFEQPGVNAAVLNRVVTGNPSAIFGTLEANGQVYLINPNGIIVGESGVINAQSFIASTFDVANAEFLDGETLNFAGDSDAKIINLGEIAAYGGNVYLIAHAIDNQGTIRASEGEVGLAAGHDVQLKMEGAEGISVRVTPRGGHIDNAGLIEAARAELQAVGSNPYALAINHSGLIRATGAQHENGRVILSSSRGVTRSAGAISAASETTTPGEVILYSKDTTEFTGTIETPDQGEVHISGVDRLVFDGQVDTENGTLILDPNNVEVTSAAATLAGASILTAVAVTGLLAANNVVVHTSGTDGEDGDIRVSEPIAYSSTNNLSFVSHRHLEVNRSVQNDGTGAVNLVAGWDGTTGLAAIDNVPLEAKDLDIAAVFATTSSFGNNGGSIAIGDGTQTTGVAVGSRLGETNLASLDLNLTAGGTTSDYTQVGFRINSATANANASGAIALITNNDVNLTGGASSDSYSQIGHGGRDFSSGTEPDGDQSGLIDVTVGRHLTAAAGVGLRSYAQLGHGGYDIDGDHSGVITVAVGGDAAFTAGGRDAYAQLGHGGRAAGGSMSGSIDVTVQGEMPFTAGDRDAYALLGHGGNSSAGSKSGTITIQQAADLTFQGGLRNAFAQLGHGGYNSDGASSGRIQITQADDISFLGGTDRESYAQFGHGGRSNNNFAHSGDINIVDGGHVTVAAGTGNDAYAQLGHGGRSTRTASHNGNITLTDVGDVRFTSAANTRAYTQLGHGGYDGDGDHTGTISILQSGAVAFQAGTGSQAYTQLGHGGYGSRGDLSGAINIADAASVSLSAAAGVQAYAQLGHGGFDSDGDHVGAIAVSSNGAIVATASSIADAYTQLGHGGRSSGGTMTGAMTLSAVGDIRFTAGDNSRAFAQLGHGGFSSGGDHSGTIAINQANDIVFTAGTATDAFAQLGHGGRVTNVASNDSISITQANDLLFTGGSARGTYAQLGHGGSSSFGDRTADITIGVANDLTLSGGTGREAYAQIGHGGYNADGSQGGTVRLDDVNDITIAGGGGRDAYAHLGFGGAVNNRDHAGTVIIAQAHDVDLRSGDGQEAYAQIGSGGRSATGTHSGDINLASINALTLASGAGLRSYTQIGNGGYNADGVQSGTINLFLNNADLSMQAGGGFDTYVQIGHGGYNNSGNTSGAITLAGMANANLAGGTNNRAFAHIGHGGYNADGDHGANIDVTATGNVMINGGTGNLAYAQLGNGGRSTDGAMSGSIILGTGSLDLKGGTGAGNDKYAQIGHGDAGTATGVGIGTGTRTGNIQVTVGGETSLENGSGSRSIWRIGHNSTVLTNISNANVTLSTATLDPVKGPGATMAVMDQDFVDKFEHNLGGSTVTVTATGGGAMLVNDGIWNYGSTNTLTLRSDQDLTVNQSITNAQAGLIDLAFGQQVAGTFDMLAAIISTADVSIRGGAGDDTFNLPDGLDAFFPGTYTVDGGAGIEILALLDSTDVDGETYALTNSQLTKNATTIDYANFESLALSTGDGDDTVDITELASLAMNLDGGGPTIAPGDLLRAIGFEHTPGAAGAGSIDPFINYIDFEQVEFTPVPRPPTPILPVPVVPLPITPTPTPTTPEGLLTEFQAAQQNDVRNPIATSSLSGQVLIRNLRPTSPFPLRVAADEHTPEDWLSWHSSYDDVDGEIVLELNP